MSEAPAPKKGPYTFEPLEPWREKEFDALDVPHGAERRVRCGDCGGEAREARCYDVGGWWVFCRACGVIDL